MATSIALRGSTGLFNQSTQQQAAVTGRRPRQEQADILRTIAPTLNRQNQAFRQGQERFQLAQEAQRTAQQQQTLGNIISGASLIPPGIDLASDLGLFGGGSAAASTGGALAALEPVTSGAGGVLSTAAPAALSLQGAAAGVASPFVADVAGAAPAALGTTAPAAGLSLGTLAGGAGAGLAGAGIGTTIGSAIGGGVEGGFAGAGAGAVTGALAGSIIPGPGTLIGAIVGAIGGGLGGGLCIIVTCCHGPDSPEVQVARAYRDSGKMSKEAIRGYYVLAEGLVPAMEADPAYKQLIKQTLVDPLVAYGRFVLGMPTDAPAPTAEQTCVAQKFLELCDLIGWSLPSFTRSNGEVV